MGRVGGCEPHVVPGRFRGAELSAEMTGDPEDMGGQQIVGLDLGHGVYIAPYTAAWVPEGDHAGGIVWHTHEDGLLCGGGVSFVNALENHGRPVWTVECWYPLTISPSVLADCGLHGFIRGGKWEPA